MPVVTVAYIAALVYTYVAVVSTAAVALNVAAGITAWVKLALWVDSLSASALSSASISTKEKEINMQSFRDLQRAAVAADVFGRRDITLENLRRTMEAEVDAIVLAAEQIGIVSLPKSKRTQILRELKKLSCDAIGV